MTFNQTVVGSIPAVLIINILTNNLKYLNFSNKSYTIKLHWFLFYSQLYFETYSQLKNWLLTPKYLYISNAKLRLNWSRHNAVSPQLLKKTKTFSKNHLWELFWTYQQTCANSFLPFFNPHPGFYPFFIFDHSKKAVCLNHNKLYHRWVNTYVLLLNLFIKQSRPLLFMTKTFRTEVKAFNWSLGNWDYALFKKTSPYFFLKDTHHGHFTNQIFAELEKKYPLFSFITDVKYHDKNLQFLKRAGGYTIGVTPFNTDPWVVSYPIPVGAGTVLVEYFFLTLLSFIRQYAEVIQYNHVSFLWKLL